MKFFHTILAATLFLGLMSCHSHGDDGVVSTGGPGGNGNGNGGGEPSGIAGLNQLDLGPNGDDIVPLDEDIVSDVVTDVFDRYTALTTPSGERIHILIQSGVTGFQIRRARAVLAMHLEDLPDTVAGADKDDVADSISAGFGTLAIFRDEASYDLMDPAVAAFDEDFRRAYVPLFGDRVIVEGTGDYLAAAPARDDTFGATGVLVHRLGLVEQRPDWTAAFSEARLAAQESGDFTATDAAPYLNLDERFLDVTLQSQAGVWAHDPSGDGSAQEGVYAFGSRPSMAAGDGATLALLEDFFASDHTFQALVERSFTGNFDLLLRDELPYTNRSQYLRNVRLTGDNFAELFGSSDDDVLVGNAANNNLAGRSGNDLLDGGAGLDSAIFFLPRAEFTILDNGDGSFDVRHDVEPGIGTDRVLNMERLIFSDETIVL